MRLDCGPDRVLLAVADHQHHPLYAGYRQRRGDRASDHRKAAQRQQHLVDLAADPRAGAGREDDDGRTHQWTRAVAMAATPAPRPVSPSPSVVVAASETGAPTASRSTALASSRRGPRRGRFPMTCTATFPIS